MNPFRSLTRYIRDHWRGKHPLILTLLISLLSVRVSIGALQSVVPSSVLNAVVLVSVICLVWQLVGAWRAIELHTRVNGGMALVWAGYAVLAVVAFLTLVQVLDALARRADPPSPPGGAPYVAFQLPLEDHGRVAVIEGSIGWSQHTALVAALNGDNAIERIELNSHGGLVIAARALATVIERYQLDTQVESDCFSACTLVFLAGATRTLGGGGVLGFHQYAIDSHRRIAATDVATELERDRQYFASRGVKREFLDQVFSAKPGDMWFPDHAFLRRTGVVSP